MKTEEIGSVKYGNLRMSFFLDEKINEYILENSIPAESFFPKTQFFYQGILMKLGINHEENKQLDIVFFRVKFSEKIIIGEAIEKENVFDGFPIHIDDKIYLSDFYVNVGEKKDE